MVVVIVVVVIGAVRGSGGVMCIHGRVEPQPLCVCEYVLYGTHFVRTTRKHHAPDEAAPCSPCPGVIPFIHAARARQALAVGGGHVVSESHARPHRPGGRQLIVPPPPLTPMLTTFKATDNTTRDLHPTCYESRPALP